jgi:hypothetical protein
MIKNLNVLNGLGLTITRSDGQSMLWDDFWQHNYDEFLYYWVRCEEKPQILPEQNTHGRVI